MTLFPTNAQGASHIPDAEKKVPQTWDAIMWREHEDRIRAQGRAEGMEAAAKIVDAINSHWPPFIAAAIREAAKTKGP